jgi:tetratricopeptide (TPR) repeat protein
MGFSKYALKKYQESMSAYKKAIEINNENSAYSINLAYAYIQADSSRKALEEFQNAIVKYHPELIGEVYCQIGHIYFKEKNYKESKKAYQTVLQYDSENIDAYYMGAISDDEMKNTSQALAAYKKALQLIKSKITQNELESNERYNTIRKRIADLTKTAGSRK